MPGVEEAVKPSARGYRSRAATGGLGVAVLLLSALALWLALREPGSQASGGTLRNPIDQRQQTALAFGERSHWLQPWRAYLDTPPATRLRDAIGIQFNVEPAEAAPTARLIARSGFRRARIEVGWDSVSDGEPARLSDPGRLRTYLEALRGNGIRPLLLLNAHHGAPGPTVRLTARLTRAARRGDREVRLDRATARAVAPGRTGLDAPEGKAADVLFTAIRPNGTAVLSKPLPRDLDAGGHPASTLRYEPFGPPRRRDGRRNPVFERTLAGWLEYVRVVTVEARSILGSDAFDVEVWNELGFGSDFLFQERYYDPPRETGKGDVTREILHRTVSFLRDPANALPDVGIGNGFANQRPWDAGSTSPRGLTAIGKHPYYLIRRFPDDSVFDGDAPLDARGRPDFTRERAGDGKPRHRDRFVPRYDAFFPEYILTGIQTEHLIRDISPITTEVYGVRHGRRTHPPGGRPPAVWVTETNLDPSGADPSRPGMTGRGPIGGLTPRDVEHLHAKAALRYLTAFVNKGVSALYLFGAKGENLALIQPAFFEQLRAAPGRQPGDEASGETMQAVGRLARELARAEERVRPRPLRLLSISDDHGHQQFGGDGTPAHPPLRDRDAVAFFPFQLRDGEYLAATYVMTRNLAKLYRREARESDVSRFDLPEAPFRLAIGGLGRGRVRVSASDPLTGDSVRARVVSRSRRRVVVELPLTDSPRLLKLSVR